LLFNSFEFIGVFLPVVFAVYYLLGDKSRAKLWLALASLAFYGWWDWRFVPLICGSILVNFALHLLIRPGDRRRFPVLVLGVSLNLALLAFFKYADFLVTNLNVALALSLPQPEVTLPLGISFFTFLQIAFLVDTWRGAAPRGDLTTYGLFVLFFPHLIAGPIMHHAEMMPQFEEEKTYRFRWTNLFIGLNFFVIGLFKKTVLADSIAPYSTQLFGAAAAGAEPSLFEAWGGALAYTLQIYFDFSGYSDMAIGLAHMFGVSLPINFNSPYKSASIVDFWRRWHMTLSRFLRDYLYLPLGGNRRGPLRRYANLMAVMLLGGLWHGAGWTFLLWGGLHGCYLVLNHVWRALTEALGWRRGGEAWWSKALGVATTFLAVVVAWVPFRAESLEPTLAIYRGMLGLNGAALPAHYEAKFGPLADLMTAAGVAFVETPVLFNLGLQGPLLAALLATVFLLPNSQELLSRFQPYAERFRARAAFTRVFLPHRANAALLAVGALVCLLAMLRGQSEFLYFQF